MEVKSFKLMTGEEIVARVMDETRTEFVVDSPQVLQFQRVSQNQMGLAFVPWALSNPEISDLQLSKSSIVAVYPPASDVEKQYLSQTSKIALMG